jgi:hypothetical protein
VFDDEGNKGKTVPSHHAVVILSPTLPRVDDECSFNTINGVRKPKKAMETQIHQVPPVPEFCPLHLIEDTVCELAADYLRVGKNGFTQCSENDGAPCFTFINIYSLPLVRGLIYMAIAISK